jgi:hypothetical protein
MPQNSKSSAPKNKRNCARAMLASIARNGVIEPKTVTRKRLTMGEAGLE